VLYDKVLDGLLAERQAGLFLAEAFDKVLVGPFVGLRSGTVHGRALATVQDAELDARGIDCPAHGPAQGIDFTHDLSFGHSADGRITAHQGNRIQIAGQEGRFRPAARGRQGGLDPGVAATNHHNIKIVG